MAKKNCPCTVIYYIGVDVDDLLLPHREKGKKYWERAKYGDEEHEVWCRCFKNGRRERECECYPIAWFGSGDDTDPAEEKSTTTESDSTSEDVEMEDREKLRSQVVQWGVELAEAKIKAAEEQRTRREERDQKKKEKEEKEKEEGEEETGDLTLDGDLLMRLFNKAMLPCQYDEWVKRGKAKMRELYDDSQARYLKSKEENEH